MPEWRAQLKMTLGFCPVSSGCCVTERGPVVWQLRDLSVVYWVWGRCRWERGWARGEDLRAVDWHRYQPLGELGAGGPAALSAALAQCPARPHTWSMRACVLPVHSHLFLFVFFNLFLKYLCISLAAPGLSCSGRDLPYGTWHLWFQRAGAVAACELSVAARGTKFPDWELNPGRLHGEHRVLASGPPEKSPTSSFFYEVTCPALL